MRLWFRNDRATNHYRPPSSYTIQYLNGSTWTNVASAVKNPATPQANYNVVRFAAVNTTGCGCRSRTPPGSRPASPR